VKRPLKVLSFLLGSFLCMYQLVAMEDVSEFSSAMTDGDEIEEDEASCTISTDGKIIAQVIVCYPDHKMWYRASWDASLKLTKESFLHPMFVLVRFDDQKKLEVFGRKLLVLPPDDYQFSFNNARTTLVICSSNLEESIEVPLKPYFNKK
jgi:hypothetical protein